MKKLLTTLAILTFTTQPFAMGVVDDPLVTKLTIDQLENRSADGENSNVLEGEFWVGRDLSKIWTKFEIEGLGESNSESEISLWYSKAYDAYWDIQYGIKSVNHPDESRSYIGAAFKGLAPYWIETDAQLLISEKGQLAVDLSFEYEYMITQKWVVTTEAKFNLYSKDDDALEIGKGLANSEIGVRIGYEFKREFAPYIGINFENLYGKTADMAKTNSSETSETQFVVGLHMWF